MEKVMFNTLNQERLSNFLHAALAVTFALVMPLAYVVHIFMLPV